MARCAGMLALLVLVFSCKLLEKTEDGELCDDDTECDSNTCQTICIRPNCDSDTDCRVGWRCEYDDGNVLGFGGGSACQATCGSCPSTQHCGRETRGTSALCQPGPLQTLTVSGPASVTLGSEVTFEARHADELPFVQWYLLGPNQEPQSGNYLGTGRTLTIMLGGFHPLEPGRYSLYADARDVNDPRKGTAEGQLEIELR